MLLQKERPGRDVEPEERSKHHRGRSTSRDSQSEKRHHGGGGRCVVRRLGSGDTARLSLSERETLDSSVFSATYAAKAATVAPAPGRTPTTNPTTVPRTIAPRHSDPSPKLDDRTSVRGGERLERLDSLEDEEDFAHSEESDGEDDEVDSVEKPQLTEGVARDRAVRIEAHGRESEPR